MSFTLQIKNLCKEYNGTEVLKGFTASLSAPGIYCLMAPSGAGKTTLFRIILGLEKADSGSVSASAREIRFSAVFQEDRLVSHLSPIENTALVMPGKPDREAIKKEMLQLLPEESLNRPVSALSGGMKRRCAFFRAMAAASDVVIMDEPFTGLDDANRDNVIRYLLEHRNNRLFLIATHDREDAGKLGGKILTF